MDRGVGTTLREGRNRRKIDLSEVEAATQIRVRYLLAIENEEWERLPGEAYARAFVRTYASYLGLDGERLADDALRRAGEARQGERVPRVEPASLRAGGSSQRPRVPPRLLAALVSIGLLAILVVVGLSQGGGGGPSGFAHRRPGNSLRPPPSPRQPLPRTGSGLSLRLLARAEVWVCLLDRTGRPLVDGRILSSGAEAGPFRSGSFTVSLGNGEVTMTVNGQQQRIPMTSSPIGYSIEAGGRLRELPEGERPTCT
jgi:cytoskeleton protein RodZ